MKIVVLDGYTLNPGDLDWSGLEALGECRIYDRTPYEDEQETINRIKDAEIVLTNKTPLTENIFASCPGIKYVGVLATGYNIVDVKAAGKRKIPVTNIPAYGTASVGQFAIGLLLEICHHIGHHNEAVHSGKWTNHTDWCFWDYPLIELEGKTMGIIGYGRIGQMTGRVAQALGMKVLAYSPHKKESLENGSCRYAELEEIFSQSDVIALHCPLFPETEGLINKDSISRMKDGVIILNNSRGQLIVEQDLADALNSGKVAAAGLDVVSTEPVQTDNPLLRAKNCIITPHISWAPKASRKRLMDLAVSNMKAFLEGSTVHVVNGK